jgi:hypothetical protein
MSTHSIHLKHMTRIPKIDITTNPKSNPTEEKTQQTRPKPTQWKPLLGSEIAFSYSVSLIKTYKYVMKSWYFATSAPGTIWMLNWDGATRRRLMFLARKESDGFLVLSAAYPKRTGMFQNRCRRVVCLCIVILFQNLRLPTPWMRSSGKLQKLSN